MHKDDPIMLAAASSVKNKMDKIQQAGQAQASGQKPPPVNEQVIESMAPHPQGGPQASNQLPEQQGIAQLPTPNMQHMAGGGIVAFADGGYTDEQMMDDNNPVMRMAEGGVARFADQGLVRMPNESFADFRRRTFEAELQSQRDRNATENSAREEERQKRLAARGDTNIVPPSPFFDRAPLTTPSGAPIVASASAPAPTPYDPATATRASQYAPATTEAGSGNPGAGAGNLGATQQRPPSPTGGIATIPTQDYRAQMDSYMPKENVDPFAAQRTGLSDARTKAAQENRDLLKTDIAAEGMAGKAQEERLGKREGELGKQKDLNLHMSLIEAGLATMQSRGKGLAGIAEGAGIGMKSYTSGINLHRWYNEYSTLLLVIV
jgi:hypothetical protein